MQYRTFGRLPVEVSDIGFGAWQIGGAWGEVTEADGRAALEAALEAGVTFIDTADVYGDGRSERIIASVLKEWTGKRPYVATKAGAHSLAMSFARELAPAVRVNTIEPGPILFLDEHGDAWRQQVLARTPLAREGGLEPIWQAVRLLMANDYMTGASIRVDGGRALAVI